MKKVGFIGVGAMGKPMAMNLLKRGFDLAIVGHRNRAPVEELKRLGAKEVNTPRELAQKVGVTIIMVPASPQVEEVVLGEKGLIEGVRPGSIVIDMGTSYPPSTKKIASLLEEKGAEMLDAPVSGGVKGAKEGTLSIMVGGKKRILEECKEILQAMGSNIFYFGDHGTGHLAKLINNLISIVNLVTLTEALTFATKQGLNLETLYKALSVSSANSSVLQGNFPSIMKRNFEVAFKLNLAYKDLNLITTLGRENGVPLPLTNIAQEVFQMGRALGYGEENQSTIIKVWEKLLGIEVRA